MVCTLLGTGTSHGIPVIGCDCAVCASDDPRDRRFRASAFIQSGFPDAPGHGKEKPVSLLVDAGPDFRMQALVHRLRALDAALITHSHADHIHGMDDLRVFCHRRLAPQNGRDARHEHVELPVYATAETTDDIRSRFAYAFKPTQEGGGKPKITLIPCEGFTPEHPLAVGSLSVVYIPMLHGSVTAAGWLVSEEAGGEKHSIAYLTDCSEIPDESLERIHRAAGVLDHAVIDGLRKTPHSTHFSFDQAFEAARKIGAKRTWITHICHLSSHEEITAYFERLTAETARKEPQETTVLPAWDGMKLYTLLVT
jgi:phosphoribosyl 1,2-cyclic phosphate phosphodiesterase